ncbi:hypothetical protein TNCV_3003871 [Trichonephila clavipes]|nr:hypothetical protein TNCV_3003871 [Trichonephila clavipes]
MASKVLERSGGQAEDYEHSDPSVTSRTGNAHRLCTTRRHHTPNGYLEAKRQFKKTKQSANLVPGYPSAVFLNSNLTARKWSLVMFAVFKSINYISNRLAAFMKDGVLEQFSDHLLLLVMQLILDERPQSCHSLNREEDFRIVFPP